MSFTRRFLGGGFEAARILAVRLRLSYQTNYLGLPSGPVSPSPVPTFPVHWESSRILVVGQQEFGGTGRSRLEAFRLLASGTEGVDLSFSIQGLSLWQQIQTNHLYCGERIRDINRRVAETARAVRPDIVWVEKGLHLWPETLQAVRETKTARIIHFSPDNQRAFANQSRHYLWGFPLYDTHVTTKPDDVEWLRCRGARHVEQMGKGFDPQIHRPFDLTPEEQQEFGCEVGFVGHWEPWREQLLLRLEERGYAVKVWGGGWQRARHRRRRPFSKARQLVGHQYAKAVCGAKISLCLLSRWFGDRTTARSVEIPACGGFLLAERNLEHLELFREGEEAEFYATEREMLEKIGRYLRDEAARRSVALAGRARCLRGYANAERLRDVMNRIEG